MSLKFLNLLSLMGNQLALYSLKKVFGKGIRYHCSCLLDVFYLKDKYKESRFVMVHQVFIISYSQMIALFLLEASCRNVVN